MIKYKVEVGYYDFMFAEAADAMIFAKEARLNLTDRDDTKVRITLELDVPEEEAYEEDTEA